MRATRSITKTEAAFQAIRSAIEEGHYRPGERLPLHRLIADLEMSPTPIREALRLLQADGLVHHEPHHGVAVAAYEPETADEVHRLRLALEPLAVELAVERGTDEQLSEVGRLHDVLRRAVQQEPMRTDVAALNAAWHRSLYACAGSRHLGDFIARLWTSIPVEALWQNRRAHDSIAEHAGVMDAVERRDGARARNLMREHVARGDLTEVRHRS